MCLECRLISVTGHDIVVQVKLVVPQSTATVIVGKGGDSITRVQKESSARVHMSHKAKDESSLQERIITVQGQCRQI